MKKSRNALNYKSGKIDLFEEGKLKTDVEKCKHNYGHKLDK